MGSQATEKVRHPNVAASLSAAESCGSPGWRKCWKKDGDNVDGQGNQHGWNKEVVTARRAKGLRLGLEKLGGFTISL